MCSDAYSTECNCYDVCACGYEAECGMHCGGLGGCHDRNSTVYVGPGRRSNSGAVEL
jgi:hypothetical protein